MDAHRPANADDARQAADLHGHKAREFRNLWDAHHARVHSYVVRRVSKEDADDVVAAVFETAWRRWTSVPGGDAGLWWLLSCARKSCSNSRRSLTRRANLAAKVRRQAPRDMAGPSEPDVAERVVTDAVVREALMGLSPDDREALLLSVWDDLDPAGVAAVLGISRPAAQKRIVRARERFEERYVGLSAERPDRTLTGEETP